MATQTSSASNRNLGFVVRFGREDAKRQLRISVGIVSVLTIGIVAAAVTVGGHPMAATRDIVAAQPLTTLHAESNVTGAKAI